MPDVQYGAGRTKYGPGVQIDLTPDEVDKAINAYRVAHGPGPVDVGHHEVATAIDAYLVAHGVIVRGPRTVRCDDTYGVYVDPSGYVIAGGVKFSGRGPE